ncbi:MAG: carbonic anhydrase family protein [Hyphomonadaceae bacterium]|nr:carbonic anhydrase family protein [Hyphomonadaceae bacterium]
MRVKFAASAVALALAACSAGSSEHAEAGHESAEAPHGGEAHGDAHAAPHAGLGPASAHAAPSQGGDHWAYNDQAAWAQQSGVCGSGAEQSPINLSSAAPMAEMPDLAPRYLDAAGALQDNGHTLQFAPDQANAMLMVGQSAYSLAQFHFHSPAEHTLDRRAFPVELHFVHRNSAGQLAVLGVFIEEGPENPEIGTLLHAIPGAQGEANATHLQIDLNALLPTDRAYFAYAGSLTTPPCSEGVRWHVLRTPIQASAAQIAQLREKLGSSSRHVQPLNQRTVMLGT